MSPKAGAILLDQIAPRFRSAVPHIKTVGCEDSAELYQDGLAMAAKLLHDLEVRGKVVTAGNVSYYVLLHLRSGRRSTGSGRTDVMSRGAQLDHKAVVLSVEEEIGFDAELSEPIRMGDLLAGNSEDPSNSACRNLDWEAFIETHDDRYGAVVLDMAQGKNALECARSSGESYHHVRQLREKMADDLAEFMGSDIIADSVRASSWRAGINAAYEKAACRADRRLR